MCLFLQVLQPVRDFVWLLRGGPPPGPAILARLEGFGKGMIAINTLSPDVREVRLPGERMSLGCLCDGVVSGVCFESSALFRGLAALDERPKADDEFEEASGYLILSL